MVCMRVGWDAHPSYPHLGLIWSTGASTARPGRCSIIRSKLSSSRHMSYTGHAQEVHTLNPGPPTNLGGPGLLDSATLLYGHHVNIYTGPSLVHLATPNSSRRFAFSAIPAWPEKTRRDPRPLCSDAEVTAVAICYHTASTINTPPLSVQ